MSSELLAGSQQTAYEYAPFPPGQPGRSASDVLADAWAQAEEIREQARLTGEAEGRAAGLAAAQADVQRAVSALTGALGGLESVRDQLLSALERDAVDLAFQITEQILAGVLESRPERVIDVARNALRRVTDRHRVTLVVHPLDLELVAAAVGSLSTELGGIEHCDVQADRRVGQGGVIVRTDAGEVDATIDVGLGRAREVVAAALRPERDAD